MLIKQANLFQVTFAEPTTVGDYYEFGRFTTADANGAHNIRISITISSASNSVSKAYILAIQYDQTNNTWQFVDPVGDSGVWAGTDDFSLLANVNAAVATFRLVRSAGTTAGTVTVTIENVGNLNDAWATLTNTGSMTIPTTKFYPTYPVQPHLYGTGAPPTASDYVAGTIYIRYAT